MPAAETCPTRQHGSETAARHTYDVGYSKWEKFDADAALAELDRPTPKTEVAELPRMPPIDRSLEPMEMLDAAIARLQEPKAYPKQLDAEEAASIPRPVVEAETILDPSSECQEVKPIAVDVASTTAHKLTAEYEKWQDFDEDLAELDDDAGTDFYLDSSGLDLNALTGPEDEVSQIRAHWRREARKMAKSSRRETRQQLQPNAPMRTDMQPGPVQERPSVCEPSSNAMKQSYDKWKSFDADDAILQLDNEDTTEEGKAMRLNADPGSAFLTTEGYTKDREEYDLDEDIQRNMGNLKQILAQNFQDASALKAEGNELLRAGKAGEASAKYAQGISTLQLASHASVLMTTSLAEKQSRLLADLQRNLAAAQIAVGDFAAAVDSVDEVLRADDNDGKARYRRAVALLRLRRFSEASDEVGRLESRAQTCDDAAVRRLREEITAVISQQP